jgi:hypothetical protein
LESRLPVRREALWWRKIRAGSQMPAQARGTAVGALGIETPAIERNFRGHEIFHGFLPRRRAARVATGGEGAPGLESRTACECLVSMRTNDEAVTLQQEKKT